MNLLRASWWFVAANLTVAAKPHVASSAQTPGVNALNSTGFVNAVSHMSAGGKTLCVSGTVLVEASTTDNIKFALATPKNQTEVTQTFVSLWTAGSTLRDDLSLGSQRIGGKYDIGATLCLPAHASTTKVQILTHGIGFDRRYWDISRGYSYVDVAATAGYATLFYDRLGVGESSKPDPIQVVQSPLELSILEALVAMLRHGQLGGQKYQNVVGVGHSFGSSITQGLSASQPRALDAVVLTGFSTNTSGMAAFSLAQNPAIASANDPIRWAGLSSGYLVVDTPIAGQSTFLHAPGFDPSRFSLSNTLKDTVTLGEYLTTGDVVHPARGFNGSVAVVAGVYDFGFCSGNCSYPINILAELPKQLYPDTPAHKITTYRAPDAGHGLNFHYSAEAAFEYIQDFLNQGA